MLPKVQRWKSLAMKLSPRKSETQRNAHSLVIISSSSLFSISERGKWKRQKENFIERALHAANELRLKASSISMPLALFKFFEKLIYSEMTVFWSYAEANVCWVNTAVNWHFDTARIATREEHALILHAKLGISKIRYQADTMIFKKYLQTTLI